MKARSKVKQLNGQVVIDGDDRETRYWRSAITNVESRSRYDTMKSKTKKIDLSHSTELTALCNFIIFQLIGDSKQKNHQETARFN